MSKQNQHKPNVPELRFPEFSGEWEEINLGDIIEVCSGKDYKHLDIGPYPVYGTGGYMLNVSKYLYEYDAIGIGRKGTINKPYLLKGPFWTVDTLFYCVPKINQDTYFLLNLFQKINWKKYDESTGVPSLSKKTINTIRQYVPEYKEQQKIGGFFNELDRQIELEEKKLALLEEQKKGYMQKIFSQELRFKDENGNEYPEWEEKRLGEIAEVTMGQSPKSKNYTNDSNYMVLVQGNADLKDGKVYPRLFTKEKTKITNTNDILLTVRAPVGEIGISQLPVVIGRGVCSIKSSKFIYFYLEYLKEVNWWSRISQGSTFESISGKEIRELVVRLPIDANEQYKIITIFNKINDKISDLKRKIELIRERKKTLLRKVFI